ncbi:MAG TPA: hypothetical protein VGE12_02980 [Noviherbaspirillum sp.]
MALAPVPAAPLAPRPTLLPDDPPAPAGPQSAAAVRSLPVVALFCTLRVVLAAAPVIAPVFAGGGQSTDAPDAPDAPLVVAPPPLPAPGEACGATGRSVP